MQISRARHELPDWTQFLKGMDSSMASKLERDITDNQNSYVLSPYNQDPGKAGYAGPEYVGPEAEGSGTFDLTF